jgi:hypothetical protein
MMSRYTTKLGALLMGLLLTAASAQATTIANWNFDEGTGAHAADASGNGHHAGLVGNAAWSTDTPDGAGHSLDLTGGGYAVVDDHADLDLQGHSFRLSAWVKLESFNRNWSAILAKRSHDGVTNPGWMLLIGGHDQWGRPEQQHRLAFSINGGVHTHLAIGPDMSGYLGRWVHVEALYSVADGSMSFALDGAATPASFGHEITDGTGNVLGIGADAYNGGSSALYALDGRIDQAEIAVMPEPTTLTALAWAGAGLIGYARRRRKA